jgi:hypothetical protein
MKRIATIHNVSLERSFCAGRSGVAFGGGFRAEAIAAGRRILNFSPVRIIRKFLAALRAPAGLRNKSYQPRRNHTSIASRWRPPARSSAFRRRSLDWPQQFFQAEFVGLKSPGPKRAGRNPSEGI